MLVMEAMAALEVVALGEERGWEGGRVGGKRMEEEGKKVSGR